MLVCSQALLLPSRPSVPTTGMVLTKYFLFLTDKPIGLGLENSIHPKTKKVHSTDSERASVQLMRTYLKGRYLRSRKGSKKSKERARKLKKITDDLLKNIWNLSSIIWINMKYFHGEHLKYSMVNKYSAPRFKQRGYFGPYKRSILIHI